MKNSAKATIKEIKGAVKAVQEVTKVTYYDEIPLSQLFNACVENGFVPLQEDNTLWGGFLCGENGTVIFPLAKEETKTEEGIFSPSNRALLVQWYKMGSGRYEITSYVS